MLNSGEIKSLALYIGGISYFIELVERIWDHTEDIFGLDLPIKLRKDQVKVICARSKKDISNNFQHAQCCA